MTQAYPQFTPVQILEAGQRAIADGRHEYATQFFQHLIDHYGDTPEAADARAAMARLQGSLVEATPQVNGRSAEPKLRPPPHAGAAPARQPPVYSNGNRHHPGHPAPQPGPIASPPDAQLNVNGAGARPTSAPNPGPAVNGVNGHPGAAMPQPAPQQLRNDPPFGEPVAPQDMPRHIARHVPSPTIETPQSEENAPVSYVPAPEKNYIIGRVIAGLMLLIGILGILASVVLIYGAVSDPKLFGVVGLSEPGQPLMFSVGVFVGSVLMLIVAQMATAIFNGADAMADVARLERYRAGDYGDDE